MQKNSKQSESAAPVGSSALLGVNLVISHRKENPNQHSKDE
jgi:hypothetical protein